MLHFLWLCLRPLSSSRLRTLERPRFRAVFSCSVAPAERRGPAIQCCPRPMWPSRSRLGPLPAPARLMAAATSRLPMPLRLAHRSCFIGSACHDDSSGWFLAEHLNELWDSFGVEAGCRFWVPAPRDNLQTLKLGKSF